MVEEGLIDRETALMRVEPTQLEQLLVPGINEKMSPPPAFFGLEASPGAAVGKAVFDVARAVEWAAEGTPVILVRWETTPDDIDGLFASEGILTSHGGKTSHAAVVARAMGTPAVTGASEIVIDADEGFFTAPGGLMVREGEAISIDGTTGRVFIEEVELVAPAPPAELTTLLEWADQARRLGIWANADTGKDAARAAELGAEGIGLARTEHMFMGDRLPVVRRISWRRAGGNPWHSWNSCRLTISRPCFGRWTAGRWWSVCWIPPCMSSFPTGGTCGINTMS